MSNSPHNERRVIRDAMDRLLDGTPIRSDGKLTIKSLAEEAGVKRWLLTHKHTDLQDEYRARIASRDTLPSAQQTLVDQNEELRARNAELSEKLAAARDEAQQLARIVQVLALKNEQLRPAADAKVRALPGTDGTIRQGNTASGELSAVTGGQRNTADGAQATVTGGEDNTASGVEAVVTGGTDTSPTARRCPAVATTPPGAASRRSWAPPMSP